MKQIGFKNYKRFEELPLLDLAPITLLVGPNNSGKSTFLRGLMLGYNNTKNLTLLPNYHRAVGYSEFENPVFSFDLTDFNAGISNFKRSLNYNSFCNEIDFTVSLQYVNDSRNETTFVDPTNIGFVVNLSVVPDVFSDTDERALGRISKITISDCVRQYLYCFDFIEKTMSLEIKDGDYERNVTAKTTTLKLPIKDLMRYYDHRDSISMPALCNYIKNFAIVLNALKEYVDDKDFAKTYPAEAYAPYLYKITSSDACKSFNEIIEIVPDVDNSVLESASNLESALFYESELIYIPVYSPSRSALYNLNDKNDYVARAIQKYKRTVVDKDQEDNAKDFIKGWLKDFKIGRGFEIKSVEGEYYSLKILPMDNEEWIYLADLGTGSIHLMILLLNIASLMFGHKVDYTGTEPTIIIEEPEQNLHPAFQSTLAHLFLKTSKYVNFIVETHSEYLIRKAQVLTAKKEYLNFSEKTDNGREYGRAYTSTPFRVYYLPENDYPYDMEMKEDGWFARKFGTGFIDEADNSYLEMLS